MEKEERIEPPFKSIGVNRPSGSQVPVSNAYPSLSQSNTPKYAYSQKVVVLLANGFNSNEVTEVLNTLDKYGVFVVIVSQTLGTVTGDDGTQSKVDETFLTTSPYLIDTIYIVGGNSKNQEVFNYNVNEYLAVAYKHYKPIGVASSGQSFIRKSERNNFAGVVFFNNNPNFGEEYVTAIAQQRFWDRE